MSSLQSGALTSVEVMLKASLKRLNNLNGENREALYDEYKEWLEAVSYTHLTLPTKA